MIESTGNGPQQPADGPLSPLRNAALLLKQAHARIDNLEQLRRQPIAIVGAGCRLPGGVNDLDTFWSRLLDGFDAVREVPAERWNVDEHYDPEPGAQGKMYTRWGGFLENVDQFDNDFFGISYREAAQTDPQHRLLLETAWEALESAGVVPASLAGSRTGVYVGIISNDYALAQSKSLITLDGFAGTGSAHSIAANRLSYVLNLRGPSLALDTACSSSLVAIHLACQSLVRGETDLGLAGGVNLTLGPELTVALSAARMMAPDGRCKAFDASANGYVRGEGCGMVLLKRLADARRDGDRILGVIRGSAVNHDGRSNGLSAPSGPAQEDVIRAALESAGVEPSRISYVEAHGTGTKLGDSIEIQALLESLGKDRTAEKLLHVGSVKTNIGHLEAAAGIAGLLKALLILKHKTIPASLHVRQLNPLLAIEGTPLRIPTETTPIPASDGPLCVGVSSFGFGGTNSHIVLEEPPVEPAKPAASQRDWHLLTLSGAKPGALRELARKHRECVDPSLNGHSPAPAPLAAASALTRTHSRYRAALPFRTLDDLRPQLEKLAAAPENAADVSSSDDALRRSLQEHGVAFLFTGQGAQYIGMGKGLYASEPVFRAAVDRAAKFLEPKLGCNLAGFITGADQPAELLTRTRFTQPAMFVVQHALVELWRSWGVEPSAVLGHSVAEFAAAWAAGVLSLEDALTLVAERGRLMDSLPSGGAMAAVLALVEDVRAELARYAGRVEIAALNGPQNTVVAGEESAVLAVVAAFEARGVRATRLDTSHAFHSRLMEPALDEFERIASSFVHHAPNCDFISTLTGAKLTGPINADYWRRHARQAVRFAEAIESLVASGRRVFVEIGPQPTLIGMARRCTPAGDFAWLPSLRRQAEDGQTIFTSLGRLYELGQEVAWNAVYPREMLRGVELPTYPFQRQRCWITEHRRVASASIVPGVEEAVHPLLGR
ncbi:MAG TPA: type I polyketide synthase, partial [Pirellulales bacterium]